jgi:hypothetical protein
MVRGRSASWSSSSGMGAASVEAVLKGRRGLGILLGCCVLNLYWCAGRRKFRVMLRSF